MWQLFEDSSYLRAAFIILDSMTCVVSPGSTRTTPSQLPVEVRQQAGKSFRRVTKASLETRHNWQDLGSGKIREVARFGKWQDSGSGKIWEMTRTRLLSGVSEDHG